MSFSNPSGNIRLGVFILAAGASSRMGRPKLLLPWGDTSVLGHLLNQWRALSSAQIAVVCAEANTPVRAELDRLGVSTLDRILNPMPELGMFSSIQCAARWQGWQSGLTHWAVALGDQPLVHTDTLRSLLGFAAIHAEQICQPSRNGRGRHPVILPRTVFLQLRDSAAPNLKQFLNASGGAGARYEIDDPGLDLDLDEPADYQRGLALQSRP